MWGQTSTDQTDRPTVDMGVTLLSRSLKNILYHLGRGVRCRNICFWTFQSERNRFSMVPAPEEVTKGGNKARRKRDIVSRSVTLWTLDILVFIKGFPNKMSIKGFPNKIFSVTLPGLGSMVVKWWTETIWITVSQHAESIFETLSLCGDHHIPQLQNTPLSRCVTLLPRTCHTGISKQNVHKGFSKQNVHKGFSKQNVHKWISKQNVHKGISKENVHKWIQGLKVAFTP